MKNENANTVRIDEDVVNKDGRKSSEELQAEYLNKGGNVTKCKDHKPSCLQKYVMKGARNKHWVGEKESISGVRHTSVMQRQTEREMGVNLLH